MIPRLASVLNVKTGREGSFVMNPVLPHVLHVNVINESARDIVLVTTTMDLNVLFLVQRDAEDVKSQLGYVLNVRKDIADFTVMTCVYCAQMKITAAQQSVKIVSYFSSPFTI